MKNPFFKKPKNDYDSYDAYDSGFYRGDEEEEDGAGDKDAADAGHKGETAADERADDTSGGIDSTGPAEEGSAQFGGGGFGKNDLKDGLKATGGEICQEA